MLYNEGLERCKRLIGEKKLSSLHEQKKRWLDEEVVRLERVKGKMEEEEKARKRSSRRKEPGIKGRPG